MKYNELNVKTKKPRRRAGRGISAGLGKTAGRGTKGQGARAGSRRKPGFEGGQNPLMQRLPKLRGFKSKRTAKEVVYTEQLNELGANVDNFSLADAGLVSSAYVAVKLITKGELTKKVSVSLQAASESAKAAIQKKGGSFKAVEQVKRSPKDKAAK
jgi:large subunit ribosomal protein L15